MCVRTHNGIYNKSKCVYAYILYNIVYTSYYLIYMSMCLPWNMGRCAATPPATLFNLKLGPH